MRHECDSDLMVWYVEGDVYTIKHGGLYWFTVNLDEYSNVYPVVIRHHAYTVEGLF